LSIGEEFGLLGSMLVCEITRSIDTELDSIIHDLIVEVLIGLNRYILWTVCWSNEFRLLLQTEIVHLHVTLLLLTFKGHIVLQYRINIKQFLIVSVSIIKVDL
jgi:hypothetical protein